MNRHSPFVFFGFLVIPLVFCVAHAQDNAVSNSSDPFDKMFSQARDQERQKIMDKFSQSQQNSPSPFPGAVGSSKNPYQQNQAGQDSSKNALPASPAAPSSNIPLPSVNPTNTPVVPPSNNIYVPPSPAPTSQPTVTQPTAPPIQQAKQPPQSSTNIYG